MSKKKSQLLLGSAAMLFLLSLLNKGLGFIKSVTIASVFGATLQTDAYYVADGLLQNALIPIAEAVSVSFLPFYIGIREKSKEDAKAFTSRTMVDIFLLALVLSGILFLVSPVLLKLMLPSYTEEEVELAVFYFRILVWGMSFYMSNSLLQSLLNAEKAYGFSALTAMLNNLILTAAVILLGYRYGMVAMAAAVPFSYLLQFLILQIKSRDYGKLTFQYGIKDSRILKFCLNACPIFFGNAICELNNLVDKSLLSGMQEGAITAVSYAAVLYQFASNLIGIPLNTIIFTELAESFAAGHMDEGRQKLEKGMHICLFFCVPLTLFVIFTADLIVQITYGRGAFQETAVIMTGQGLRYYALCFLPYSLLALLFRACYSVDDTVLPFKVGLVTVSLNIILSIVLSGYMGLRGIVLATAIANTLTSLITMYVFHRTKLKLHVKNYIRPVLTIGGAALLATLPSVWWLRAGFVTNGILLFITSAILEFGIYGLILVLLRESLCAELIRLVLSLLSRKKAEDI